jgi:hypothetical protein
MALAPEWAAELEWVEAAREWGLVLGWALELGKGLTEWVGYLPDHCWPKERRAPLDCRIQSWRKGKPRGGDTSWLRTSLT